MTLFDIPLPCTPFLSPISSLSFPPPSLPPLSPSLHPSPFHTLSLHPSPLNLPLSPSFHTSQQAATALYPPPQRSGHRLAKARRSLPQMRSGAAPGLLGDALQLLQQFRRLFFHSFLRGVRDVSRLTPRCRGSVHAVGTCPS